MLALGMAAKEGKKEGAQKQESEWLENTIAIAVVTLLAFGIYGFFAGWYAGDGTVPPDERRYPVGVDDDPFLGSPDAPVTIVEFSDFQCSACALFHTELFPRLKEEYIDTGKVRFVYRDFPIESIHPASLQLSAAASCAGEQEQYWAFHAAFYEHQESLDEALINATAAANGVDIAALTACRATGAYQQEARLDFQDGIQDGEVTGTPSFFINGRRIVGVEPYETFRSLIEEELLRVAGE